MGRFTAERPPVVLIHASASSSRQWRELADMLQPRFRALPVDLHGHGTRPEWAGPPFSIADDAALVVSLLERFGPAHLVGHSYGGAVALGIAKRRPDLVRSLLAYEPVVFRALVDDPASASELRDVAATANWMRVQLGDGQPVAAARLFVACWSGPDAWGELGASQRELIAARIPSVLRHFDALFAEPFAAEALGRLDVPMLFLAGARTVDVARRIATLLGEALPDAAHETLAGMGHMGPITHAAKVNRRIEQFLHLSDASAPRIDETSAGLMTGTY